MCGPKDQSLRNGTAAAGAAMRTAAAAAASMGTATPADGTRMRKLQAEAS